MTHKITSLHLAKVLHTFDSSVAGQLPVKSGECVVVLNKVGQEWANCRHVVTGEEGVVPTSYIKEMTFKLRKGEQSMFFAIADFSTGVEGDLEFRSGDLIIGERAINDEWWEGRLALQPLTAPVRMFPLTFVVDVSPENTAQQPILEQHDEYVPQQKPPFVGRVSADFEARYNDEISLRCNDQVEVIADIDANWYSGVCNGRRGIFPKSFIEFLSALPSESKGQSNDDDIPLSRTSRSMYKAIFEEQSASLPTAVSGNATYESSVSSNRTRQDAYQNVPSAQSPLPTVLEISPVKLDAAPVTASPEPLANNRSPSAYINFDEIFNEVQKATRPSVPNSSTVAADQRKPAYASFPTPTTVGAVPDKTKPTYDAFTTPTANLTPDKPKPTTYDSFTASAAITSSVVQQPPFSLGAQQSPLGTYANPPNNNNNLSVTNGSSNKYQIQAQAPVFDSRTLTQLNSSFSLDDIVRYEMQRAVVEKLPNPPSRPPPPPQISKTPSVSKAATDDFDFLISNSAKPRPLPQSYSQAPLIPTQSHAASSSTSGSIARPRPTASISPTPTLPLLPPRSASMSFTEQTGKLGNNTRSPPPPPEQPQQSTAQFLPAYKPDRPPPVNFQQINVTKQKEKDQQGDKRSKVIDELVSTEESYLADLELCVKVILSTPVPAVGAGYACQIAPGTSHPLLGNMSEVVDVSRRLLACLKAETCKAKDVQLIGSCFVKVANELEAVYSRYCQHQPGANAFLARLNQVDATKAYVQKVTDIMKNQRTSAFSLESILLKPVQRILKYPLLLSELIRNTGPQHPDTEALASASASLSKLTGRLNETRRRLDLVLKYRRSPSITARLSRAITVHTIRKKTGRFSQRLSDSINFSAAISDEEYIKREQEFGHTDRLFRQTVRLLLRWTEAYNEFAQAQRDLVTAVNEFTSGEVACPQFAIFRDQWSRAFDTGQTSVRVGKVTALSVDPLRQLVDLFGGPTNVMKKRHDKMLDFRRLNGHQDANIGNTEENNELAIARTDFLAIDAQLSEELPSLCRFSYRILLLAYVSFFRHYSLIAHSSALGLNPATSAVSASTNLSSALRALSVFSFVKPDSGRKSPALMTPTNGSKGSSSDIVTPVATPRSSISASFQPVPTPLAMPPPIIDSGSTTVLRNTYGVADLYVTCEPTVTRQLLDLALPSGAIVGIVKRHDPTGQSDRWFVDTGVVKGFVPRRSLRSFTPSPSVDAMLLNLLD